jgi:hypothetical protein
MLVFGLETARCSTAVKLFKRSNANEKTHPLRHAFVNEFRGKSIRKDSETAY